MHIPVYNKFKQRKIFTNGQKTCNKRIHDTYSTFDKVLMQKHIYVTKLTSTLKLTSKVN